MQYQLTINVTRLVPPFSPVPRYRLLIIVFFFRSSMSFYNLNLITVHRFPSFYHCSFLRSLDLDVHTYIRYRVNITRCFRTTILCMPLRRYIATSSRMVYILWSLNQIDWKNSYDIRTSFVTSDEDSPVWSIIRKMLPGCELAPRAYVRFCCICDSWYTISVIILRKAIARCQNIVPFGWCSWLQYEKCTF